MPKQKSNLRKAVGKLISAIQKEWIDELGEPYAKFSEKVMNKAHDLLKASDSIEEIQEFLDTLTIYQYLGKSWIQAHPRVKPFVVDIENLIETSNNR